MSYIGFKLSIEHHQHTYRHTHFYLFFWIEREILLEDREYKESHPQVELKGKHSRKFQLSNFDKDKINTPNGTHGRSP